MLQRFPVNSHCRMVNGVRLLCGDAGSSAGELFYDWNSQTCAVVAAG